MHRSELTYEFLQSSPVVQEELEPNSLGFGTYNILYHNGLKLIFYFGCTYTYSWCTYFNVFYILLQMSKQKILKFAPISVGFPLHHFRNLQHFHTKILFSFLFGLTHFSIAGLHTFSFGANNTERMCSEQENFNFFEFAKWTEFALIMIVCFALKKRLFLLEVHCVSTRSHSPLQAHASMHSGWIVRLSLTSRWVRGNISQQE